MKMEITRRDWKKTIIYLAIYMITLIIGAILLIPSYWYLWIVIVIVGLILLIQWHSKSDVYRCTNCGNEFQVSFITDLISPQGVGKDDAGKTYGWKYLKCPQCKKRMKAIIVKMK
jgi:DNA-directed RNA polymerase subunit RPC12/RpoP